MQTGQPGCTTAPAACAACKLISCRLPVPRRTRRAERLGAPRKARLEIQAASYRGDHLIDSCSRPRPLPWRGPPPPPPSVTMQACSACEATIDRRALLLHCHMPSFCTVGERYHLRHCLQGPRMGACAWPISLVPQCFMVAGYATFPLSANGLYRNYYFPRPPPTSFRNSWRGAASNARVTSRQHGNQVRATRLDAANEGMNSDQLRAMAS